MGNVGKFTVWLSSAIAILLNTMAIHIDISNAKKTLKDLARELSPAKANRALSSAMNHTIRKAKTTGSKGIRQTYTMKARDVNKATTITRARPQHLEAKVNADTLPLPLLPFSTRKRKDGISVAVQRGKRKVIKGAFRQTMPNGNRGIYARGKYKRAGFSFRHKRVKRTGPDLPIGQLRAVAVTTAYKARNVQQRIKAQVQNDLPKRVQHEVKRLMDKAAKRT